MLEFRQIPQTEAIELPGSKSIAARALTVSALAGGVTRFRGLPDCDDTVAIREAIAAIRVGRPEASVKAAGTALRFSTAIAAATPGCHITLTGTERLAVRPILPLTDALARQGATFTFPNDGRYLPLSIAGSQLRGGEVEVDASISSQFISALLMVAPTAENDTFLRLKGDIVSRPYIDMTVSIMKAFGSSVEGRGNEFHIKATGYSALPEYQVEADWSAASYLFEAVALMPRGSEVRIKQLTMPEESLQGDAACVGIFRRLGVLCRFEEDGSAVLRCDHEEPSPEILEIDMSKTPDLVPAVAVAAALRGQPFCLTGVSTLRVKECDRLDVISSTLTRLGCPTIADASSLRSDHTQAPPSSHLVPRPSSLSIDPHDDHRMAMAFAIAAIKREGIEITDPGCVAKSFPDFFDQIAKIGIKQI